ncbi:MAG: hypothetical protein IJX24_06865 [Oscillospiraceae bacterium]|nr:hypothetical protein [Oscillospiraceae bacterium]
MGSIEYLDTRFQEIKEMAWKKESLPKYQGESAYSFVDEHYFQAMKYMYERYRVRQVDKAAAEKEVATLRLRYISDKTVEETRAKSYREFQEKKMNVTQWTKQLMEPEGKSIKEMFGILFNELIPALTDEVTGRRIKEGAGYSLVTGSKKLTQKEIKELEKWYP